LHALPSLFTEPSAANEIRLVRIPPDLANKVISATLSAAFPVLESAPKPFVLVLVPLGPFLFAAITTTFRNGVSQRLGASDIALSLFPILFSFAAFLFSL
jgi:hypothetical protein